MPEPWYVYCLATVHEPVQTYIGATLNPDRRLGQHNSGPQKGGARATGRRAGEWYRVCFVEGFSCQKSALSFEWHWKYFSKKEKGDPLTRRQKGLDSCLEWYKGKGKGEENELKVVYE